MEGFFSVKCPGTEIVVPPLYIQDSSGQKFYKISSGPLTHKDADALCRSEGATLFMGKTQEDWDYIFTRTGIWGNAKGPQELILGLSLTKCGSALRWEMGHGSNSL